MISTSNCHCICVCSDTVKIKTQQYILFMSYAITIMELKVCSPILYFQEFFINMAVCEMDIANCCAVINTFKDPDDSALTHGDNPP